jgi:hypothetical protein
MATKPYRTTHRSSTGTKLYASAMRNVAVTTSNV